MNKLIIYFKQAWNLIKQEKLFSSIYIIGTALSIMIVMVLAISLFLKMGNIYPETNRDRMLVMSRAMEKSKDNTRIAGLSHSFTETVLLSLKNQVIVTATTDSWGEHYAETTKDKGRIEVKVKSIDTNFWKVFQFRFIYGKPFTEADYQSEVKTAVIAESLARKLFGTTQVAGKYVKLDLKPYLISGVVKDASFLTPETFAHLWIPHSKTLITSPNGETGGLGSFTAYLLVPSAEKLNNTKKEINQNIQKFNSMLKGWEFSTGGQPDKYWQYVLRGYDMEPNFTKIIIRYILIILILLLIPSVSLAGMIESRMERRLAEIGVRRAFGSPIHTIINQIITENFLFTVIGGIVGLILSFVIFIVGKDWVMRIGQSFADTPPQGTETIIYPEMLFNIHVFAVALIISFLLNLLCSLIPAWRASHKEITYSLNAKQ